MSEQRLGVAVLALGIIFGIVGCAKNSPSTAVVVLVDFSGSIPPATAQFYADTIDSKILHELRGQDCLTVLPIDSRAESKSDPFFSIDLSHENFTDPHDGVAHKEEKERARLKTFLTDCSSKLRNGILTTARARSGFAGGTDLIGAVNAAADAFSNIGGEKRILVVFSDMIQESPELNLRTTLAKAGDAHVPSLIKRLQDSQRIPKLTGVKVVVVGAGDTVGSDVAIRDEAPYFRSIRLFWIEFFKQAGARLEEHNYGFRTQDVIPAILHSL